MVAPRRPHRRSPTAWAATVLASLLALLWLTPLLFNVMNAVKSQRDFMQGSALSWPHSFALWSNIAYAWTTAQLGPGFVNSLVYASVGAATAIVVSALAAYALAVLRIRGAFVLFFVIYSGTIFPFQMYLIPLYKAYLSTGLYDTHLGLILFYSAIATPFCLFVLRNHFSTITPEVREAAQLDGCSRPGILWHIYLPLASPSAAVLFLFQFTWIWNDLIFGMTLASSASVRPVMAALATLRGVYGGTDVPAVLVAALLASVPTVVLFFILQRYFIQGLKLRAVG